jgi:UDPglucose 6-dehydrogenase
MREAPSRVIMEGLWDRGALVSAFDPVAMPETRRIYGDREDLDLVEDAYEALRGVDALIVVTEWKSFRSPELDRMQSLMNGKVIFDGRNMFDPARFQADGFKYYGIGRS